MKKFNPKKEQKWVLKISGSLDTTTEHLKELLREQMWHLLSTIIPTEFKHAVKESYKVGKEKDLKTVEYTCIYKPFLKTLIV
jgi:hypothetical protein